MIGRIESTGVSSSEVGVRHEIGAEVARLAGDEATHQRELREAHRLFTEMGATMRAEEAARDFARDPG
jgi:hypothetical protein